MQRYRRVTLKDRIEIQANLNLGLKPTEIALKLGFHKSSISREFKRNRKGKSYSAVEAHKLAEIRFKRCRRSYKVRGTYLELVRKKLRNGWSPEQIAGRLKQEKAIEQLSYQTIYRFVRRTKFDKTYLRFGYKRRGFGRNIRRRHCRQSNWKLPISQRPLAAERRTQLGHWERDLFFGARKKPFFILSDRKSRFIIMRKSKNFKSDEIAAMTNRLLTGMPARTITNDNGSEFFAVNSLSIPVYFCKAHKPQQRGTIENSIGLIRQFIKRGVEADTIAHQKVAALQKKINFRPRKTLDYKTPYEVFYGKTVALAV